MSKETAYYAVARGLSTGVFSNWDEARGLVTGYPGADYKKFSTEEEAQHYIDEYNTKHLVIQSEKKIESKLDTLNEEQRIVIERLLLSENLMLTGGAGCGKSYLISVIYHELSQLRKERMGKGLRVQLCAMTGCAAILLGNKAKTVHSWAGIGLGKGTVSELVMKVKRNRKAFKNWLCTDLLVIDEISMMTDELFTKMNELAKKIRGNTRPFGGMQVLLVGDFFQLPPVSKSIVLEDGMEVKNRFIFESNAWKEVIGGQSIIELKEIHRQKDPVFQKILTEARYGVLSAGSIELLKNRMGIPWNEFKIKPTLIFPRRAEVEMINDMNLSALTSKKHNFKATIVYDGKAPQGFNARDERFLETIQKLDSDAPYLVELELAVDAQVMLVTNLNQEAGLVNGSRGVLSYFCGVTGLPVVEFTNGLKMTIGNATWEIDDYPGVMRSQIPLRLAYAITNHKSQGISLDSALIDIGPGIFEYGQAYVALSRCRTLEGLYIHDFEPTSIKAHPRVKEFYKSLESLESLESLVLLKT